MRRSHRSEVATIADGRTVRRLGDGGRSVFLLRPSIDTAVMVAALIGGHCQLLPLSSVAVPAPSVYRCALSSVAIVSCCRSHRSPFLLRVSGCALSIDTAVMVAALIGGHLCRCRRDGRRFFCIIKVARFEAKTAKTAKTAYFFPLFALFFADGQTVRRLGDGGRSVFLFGIGRRVRSVYRYGCDGGCSHRWPLSAVAALIGGHCRRSVSG